MESQVPHGEGHATDEEKLASTVSGQKPGKDELEEEFSDCSSINDSSRAQAGEGERFARRPVHFLCAVLVSAWDL